MKKHEPVNVTDDQEEEYYDETEPETFQDKLKKYLTMTLGGIAVVAILVVVFINYRNSQAEEQAEASKELSRIRPYYENGEYQVALEGVPDQQIRGEKILGLRQIANKFSDTETGKVAAVYAGQSLLMLNDYVGAEQFFEEALGADAALTRIGALAGKAACRVRSGQSLEAARLYEEASALAKDTGNEKHYQLFAAQLYEQDGNTDDALRIYRAMIAENQYSEYAGEAKSGIVRLGGTLD